MPITRSRGIGVSACRVRPLPWRCCVRKLVCLIAALCLSSPLASAQQDLTLAADWQQIAREQAEEGKLDVALQTVEARLAVAPQDVEAHGWRGHVLAWRGRWADAENEYRLVISRALMTSKS